MIRIAALLAISLFATLANAAPIEGPAGQTCSLTCTGGVIPPPVTPQCPSPPGAGPCDVPVPQCPSPPGTGPCAPEPPGVISCQGFSKTIVLTFDWDHPGRLATRDAGGMGINDAVVFAFKTGPYPNPSSDLASISAVEYGGIQSTRIAVLSPRPCDWSAQPAVLASASGITISVPFAVGNPASAFGFYPSLNLNTQYYFNIKNDPTGGCALSGNCDLAAQLSHSNWGPSAAAITKAVMAMSKAAK